MGDSKTLLISLIKQFYDDLERLANHDATILLEETSINLFNAMLAAAKQSLPDHEYLTAFNPWASRSVRAKDALICAGQLHALLSHEFKH